MKALIDNLSGQAAKAKGGRPPLHLWHPPLSGDIDIVIRRDGSWHHEGTPFQRASLVKLFASIMRREGEEFFLLTPVEKWRIRVEEAPFVAVEVMTEIAHGVETLVFTTNVGDRVVANQEHPLRVVFDRVSGEPSPYIDVRDGLEAKLSRPVFYQLAELVQESEHEGRPVWGVWSSGVFFPMSTAQEGSGG